MLVNNQINPTINFNNIQQSKNIRYNSNLTYTNLNNDVFIRQNNMQVNPVNSKLISFAQKIQSDILPKGASSYPIVFSPLAQAVPEEFKITPEQAYDLVDRAQEKAIENKKNNLVEFSKAYNGVAMLTTSYAEPYVTGNFEITKDFTHCGERNALAYVISNYKKDSGIVDDRLPPYGIKAFAVAKDDLVRDNGSVISPCSWCHTWLYKIAERDSKAKHIQVVTPIIDPVTKQISIHVKTLKDYLPQIDNIVPSYTKQDINKLIDSNKITYSDSANKLGEKQLNKEQIRILLIAAKGAYITGEKQNLALLSDKNAGTAVMVENSDKIFTGTRLDATSPRFFIPADLDALIKTREAGYKAEAIAIFSKNEYCLPNIDTFNWYDADHVTNSDSFQIIRIEKDKNDIDTIKVYTLDDFMLFRYKRGKTNSK
ncbi:MAG: hypothetical protein PHC34_02420 [Candidatus Gastranaerophilales bacterium]|nr:hypothetical protein [Candidatus Gastranaerophilales bacterium]